MGERQLEVAAASPWGAATAPAPPHRVRQFWLTAAGGDDGQEVVKGRTPGWKDHRKETVE